MIISRRFLSFNGIWMCPVFWRPYVPGLEKLCVLFFSKQLLAIRWCNPRNPAHKLSSSVFGAVNHPKQKQHNSSGITVSPRNPMATLEILRKGGTTSFFAGRLRLKMGFYGSQDLNPKIHLFFFCSSWMNLESRTWMAGWLWNLWGVVCDRGKKLDACCRCHLHRQLWFHCASRWKGFGSVVFSTAGVKHDEHMKKN